jgi:hypothetical protein
MLRLMELLRRQDKLFDDRLPLIEVVTQEGVQRRVSVMAVQLDPESPGIQRPLRRKLEQTHLVYAIARD